MYIYIYSSATFSVCIYIYTDIYIYTHIFIYEVYISKYGPNGGVFNVCLVSGSRVASTRKVRPITSVSDGNEGGYQEPRRSNSLSD